VKLKERCTGAFTLPRSLWYINIHIVEARSVSQINAQSREFNNYKQTYNKDDQSSPQNVHWLMGRGLSIFSANVDLTGKEKNHHFGPNPLQSHDIA